MARFNISPISVTAVVYIFLIGATHCKPWMNRGLLDADYDGDESVNDENPGGEPNSVMGTNFILSDDGVNMGDVLCSGLLIENSGERVPCNGNKVFVTWTSIGDNENKAVIRVEESLERVES